MTEGERVHVTLERCQFNCCGRGWVERTGRQEYTGTVLRAGERDVLISGDGDGPGASFFLLADRADVIAAEPIVN